MNWRLPPSSGTRLTTLSLAVLWPNSEGMKRLMSASAAASMRAVWAAPSPGLPRKDRTASWP
jgi:hypothetical protein